MKNRFLPFGLISAFLGFCLLHFSALTMAGQPGKPDIKQLSKSRMETMRANQNTGMVNPLDLVKARQ